MATNNSKPERLYTWNWLGGGYNSCTARTRAEAIQKAHAMTDRLMPDLKTLRIVTPEEMAAIARDMRTLFD
jgi:hypothetical protein